MHGLVSRFRFEKSSKSHILLNRMFPVIRPARRRLFDLKAIRLNKNEACSRATQVPILGVGTLNV